MQQKILNNRYELEQKIGEGGMARVYRGRDTRLNRRVAVKVLHSQYVNDPGFLGRFHHEAQSAANLRHPNIVDVYDVGQDGEIQYIVMEYVDGQDLKSLILRQTTLSVEQAVTIAESVASGLEAAHQAGLVHRDIKPQNIIIDTSGRVKITDFGIAKSKLSTSATETGVIFGTADYLSPEQARGQPATPASDIYSLGVTLYEMLTGRLPFGGDNSIAVAIQHISAAPPAPRMYNPRVPPQLESIVLDALDKDPAHRPPSAAAFARMLRTYREQGDQGTVLRPVPPRAAQRVPQYAGPRDGPGSSAPRQRTAPQSPAVQRTLPPRPAIAAEPPASGGMGFGGFLLGLLLIVGVLGLLGLFATGVFDDLFSFVSTARPPALLTDSTAEPTAEPTALPLVDVPNLIGLDPQQASALLVDSGLIPQEDPARNSPTVTAGLVLDQFPSAGSQITETGVVTYAVSLGPEVVTVPDVERFRVQDATSRLVAAGLQVDVRDEQSSTVSRGFVIRQEPVANLRVARGDTVTLFVSIGNDVIMPDLAGLTEDAARRRIQELGLTYSYSDYQGCDKLGAEVCNRYGPGIVVSSVPGLGEQVPRGTPVTLGVRAP